MPSAPPPKFIGLVVVFLVITLSCCPAALAQRKKPASPKPVKINLPESVRQKKKVAMQVVAVNTSSRERIAQAAGRLDGHVESKLLSENQDPNDIADDEVFLRRVYLDVAGRIPTLQEATEFLESADASRREDLIDNLLSSPDFVSNMYNFWADTLRLVERPQTNIVADPFLGYVKDCAANQQEVRPVGLRDADGGRKDLGESGRWFPTP